MVSIMVRIRVSGPRGGLPTKEASVYFIREDCKSNEITLFIQVEFKL